MACSSPMLNMVQRGVIAQASARTRTEQWLRPSAVALLAGVCAGLWLPWLLAWPLYVMSTALGVFLGWRLRRPSFAAFLIGFGLAGSHASWMLQEQLPPALEGHDVTVRGCITALPQAEARRTRFEFRVDDDTSQLVALRGKRLMLSWYDAYGADEIGPRAQLRAGAVWQFQLRVRAPRGLRNPGGFDAERYAFAQRITASGYVINVDAAKPVVSANGLQAWREAQSERIAAGTPEASSRFIRALALGDTRFLEDKDWDALRAAGLTHLIAISGFHVGLVAGFFALIGAGLCRVFPVLNRRLPRPLIVGACALFGAISYAAATGFALPTLRTALMIAVAVVARCGRRPLQLVDALALALLAILLVDPLAILAAGFWLSFGGVAWLVCCLPRQGSLPLWREFLSAQGVATLGLLPLTAILFGQASLIGPLANLLAIPWWSLVVVPLSLLGTGLDVLHAGAGQWAWWLAAKCFEPSWELFSLMASSPLALIWLPEARWYALPLAVLGAFFLLLPRGLPGKGLALTLWLPLLWPNLDLPRPGAAQLSVLDVGQGLAVVVRTANHVLLYDAGPAVPDGFDAGERAVVPALHALGVKQLNAAVISHGDNDHAGGFEAVKRGIQVMDSWAPAGSPVAAARACEAGQQWVWDGVHFRFLHPTKYFPYLKNEASCVLRIETEHGAMLLSGDIGQIIERRLAREVAADLRADVVLAAHHGSAGSSDPAFVAATGAQLSLISAGYGNRFGHPRAEVVQRWQQAGAEVLNTADGGALRVWLDSEGLAVRERRHWQPRLWDAQARLERMTKP